ncbi:MAG TPA: hypothetical protein VGL10_04125 [Gammaproteobacteria bacterium]
MQGWGEIITAASSFWGLMALLLLVFLTINMTVLKNSRLYSRLGQQKTYKIVNSVIVFTFVIAVLLIINVLIKTAGEQAIKYTEVVTQSNKQESVTTYKFAEGAVIGRVSALNIGADDLMENVLQGKFTGSITNLWDRAIAIRDLRAVSGGSGEELSGFSFQFEQAAIKPEQQYAFSGTVRMSDELFNGVIRRYDLRFQVITNAGSIELPLEIYNLEVAPALAAGLVKTNRVTIGDSEGTISFLNCEKASPQNLCGQVLEQMGAGP